MRRWFTVGVIFCLALFTATIQADTATGVAWLASQAQNDGAYSGATDLATPVQATAETLRTFQALEETTQPGVAAARQWLAEQDSPNTEYLARQLIAAAEASQSTHTLVTELLTHQNPINGGFGDFPGYHSTVLDTAFALEALSYVGTPSNATSQAVQYLLDTQQGSGGWGDTVNGADVYRTALAANSLRLFATTYNAINPALSEAHSFLLAQRSGTSWSEDHQSALALLALAPNVADVSLIQAAGDALQARQRADGSWAGDVYTTALALRALQAVAARSDGVTPTEGALTGTVILQGSGQPIAGATVALKDNPQIAVTTLPNGRFLLSGLPSGTLSLSASKAGYTTTHAVATVRSGEITEVNPLVLGVAPESGVFNAYLFATDTGLPVSDADVTLSGPQTVNLRSDANGRAERAGLTPGNYTFTIQHPEFYSVSGTATLTAGQAVELRQPLLRDGAPQNSNPVTLSGRVLDAETEQPLAGATFSVDGIGSAATDANGQFVLAEVPPGSYSATLSAPTYQSQQLTLTIPPGVDGALGDFRLFQADGPPPAEGVTLRGQVVSALDQQPVAGVTVEITDLSASTITDANGQFTLAAIPQLDFQIRLSALDYQDVEYAVSVSGFGEIYQTFLITPGGDPNATESQVSGIVTDKDTGAALANVTVEIPELTLNTTTDTSGFYALTAITALNFTLDVQAPGYLPRQATVDLPAHGDFRVDVALQAEPQVGTGAIQIIDVSAIQPSVTGTDTAHFQAQVKNLTAEALDVLLIGKVYDVAGVEIATVAPYLEGTQTTDSQRNFLPDETQTLTVPWDTEQFAPGAYRLVLRAVVPGTIWAATPLGEVIDEGSDSVQITAIQSFSGQFAATPPLLQAGSAVPAQLDALILNSGNVPLTAVPFDLMIQDPADGGVLHSASVTVAELAVGNNQIVNFGDWVPTQAGELSVVITSSTIPGRLQGTLYVGDKATGSFTIERTTVPEGTSTIAGSITVNGVDTTQANSTDPLFFAVKEAIRQGGEYTAPNAVNWHQSNRCLGCHIQTQSMAGLASALNKATVDQLAAKYLYDSLSSNLQTDGGLRASHPQYTRTQTQLGFWSLGYWNNPLESFRTRYKAAQHLYSQRGNTGDGTYWRPDHFSGWWRSNEAATAMVVQGFSELLDDAQSLSPSALNSYSLNIVGTYANGGSHTDLEYGPDGYLYTVANRVLHRFNPATGTGEVLDTNLPMTQAYGLAFADGGALWISGTNGVVQRRDPDGAHTTYTLSSGTLTDIEQGPDGSLYVADYSYHRLWRVEPDGQGEVLISGGRLRNPYGLSFTADGQLLVANFGGRNLLRVNVSTASPTPTVFAEGLSLEPLYVASDGQGGAYFTTNRYYSSGQYTPGALHYARPNGTLERLVTGGNYNNNRLFGVAVQGGTVWVGDLVANRVYELQTSTFDTSLLPTLQDQLPRAVRYVLSRYQDNTSDNIVQAMRLSILGEALPWLTDENLRTQAETAMASLADLLRNRQRADGGWGRTTSYASDPMATALVGIALDHTNPSTNDPLVRNTIQYLLNTQQADGSWISYNRILSTRLAATSLVMIYLPLALDRLGGLDVDLQLTLPTNVKLSNPSLAHTLESTTAEGLAHYEWTLIGVTAAGRQINFELTLHDMQLDEVRAVADAAYLEFANAFVPEERLRSDLPIPQVRTAKAATVTVTTDKAQYGAAEPVLLSGDVSNTGPLPFNGEVRLSIWASDGTEPLKTLAPIPVSDLAVEAQIPYTANWNTGSQFTGDYEVRALLYDSQGRLFDEDVAPFAIIATGPTLTGTISTDKAVYLAWDTVQIQSRIRNTTTNAIQPPTLAEITVYDPAGNALASAPMYSHDLPELVAEALRDVLDTLTLADAEAGTYTARLEVKDAFTEALLATDETTFEVVRDASQGLTGQVTVLHRQVYQGDPNTCTETVTNLSATALTDVTVHHLLVDLSMETVLEQIDQLTDLAGAGEYVQLQGITTDMLSPGDYACVLQATVAERTVDLGAAAFQVLEPPIRIDASLGQGERGRVLILLDDPAKHQGNDPLGPNHSPPLAAQRTYLETLLTEAGWSYTITTNDDDFTTELRTGGYLTYLLLSEHEKLAEAVQKELREAVYRGEGLIEAGSHDQRQGRIDEALGIKFKGKLNTASALWINDPLLLTPGAYALSLLDKPLRAELQGAQALGEYLNGQGGNSGVPALTEYTYGQGRSVYMGFDLLAEATYTGGENEFGELLLNALEHVYPADSDLQPGGVYPLAITLSNQGIATPGRVILTLPAGVTMVDPQSATLVDIPGSDPQQWQWLFELAEDETLTLTAWVRLPEGTHDFTASVDSGTDPDWVEQATLELTLTTVLDFDLLLTLSDVEARGNTYKHVAKYLGWAHDAVTAGDYVGALGDLVRAGEAAADIGTIEADQLRLTLARLLRAVGQQLSLAP